MIYIFILISVIYGTILLYTTSLFEKFKKQQLSADITRRDIAKKKSRITHYYNGKHISIVFVMIISMFPAMLQSTYNFEENGHGIASKYVENLNSQEVNQEKEAMEIELNILLNKTLIIFALGSLVIVISSLSKLASSFENKIKHLADLKKEIIEKSEERYKSFNKVIFDDN